MSTVSKPSPAFVPPLLTLLSAGSAVGLTDHELLQRFVTNRDGSAELAFTALVERHGTMVLRVCRSLIGDRQEAEDAFQSTFLILARKARTIRVKDTVAPWLYVVASRVSGKALAMTIRRRRFLERLAMFSTQEASAKGEGDGVGDGVLDELARLPKRYQTVVRLCDLDGFRQDEAAKLLKLPLGTVKSRLSRGRSKLRDRLLKRGIKADAPPGFSSWTGLVSLVGGWPSIALPRRLAHLAVQAAIADTSLKAGGVAASTAIVSGTVLNLTEGSLQAMFMTKIKIAVAATLGLAVVTGGTLASQGSRAVLASGSDSGSVTGSSMSPQARNALDANLEYLYASKAHDQNAPQEPSPPPSPETAPEADNIAEILAQLKRLSPDHDPKEPLSDAERNAEIERLRLRAQSRENARLKLKNNLDEANRALTRLRDLTKDGKTFDDARLLVEKLRRDLILVTTDAGQAQFDLHQMYGVTFTAEGAEGISDYLRALLAQQKQLTENYGPGNIQVRKLEAMIQEVISRSQPNDPPNLPIGAVPKESDGAGAPPAAQPTGLDTKPQNPSSPPPASPYDFLPVVNVPSTTAVSAEALHRIDLQRASVATKRALFDRSKAELELARASLAANERLNKRIAGSVSIEEMKMVEAKVAIAEANFHAAEAEFAGESLQLDYLVHAAQNSPPTKSKQALPDLGNASSGDTRSLEQRIASLETKLDDVMKLLKSITVTRAEPNAVPPPKPE